MRPNLRAGARSFRLLRARAATPGIGSSRLVGMITISVATAPLIPATDLRQATLLPRVHATRPPLALSRPITASGACIKVGARVARRPLRGGVRGIQPHARGMFDQVDVDRGAARTAPTRAWRRIPAQIAWRHSAGNGDIPHFVVTIAFSAGQRHGLCDCYSEMRQALSPISGVSPAAPAAGRGRRLRSAARAEFRGDP